jgi:hypothetical protein
VAGLQSGVEYKQFRLQRAQVELNPVFATTMHMADHQWGYVRLVSFSQHAPADMHRAISQLKVRWAGFAACNLCLIAEFCLPLHSDMKLTLHLAGVHC